MLNDINSEMSMVRVIIEIMMIYLYFSLTPATQVLLKIQTQ